MSDLDRINKFLSDAFVNEKVESVGTRTRSKMLNNIKRRAAASAPEGTYTVKADDQNWEPFDLGIDRRLLIADQGDGTETAMYRLQPGAKFVSHEHTHQEACWVVEGDILVGDHLVQSGEMHVAEVGFDHPEIVARTNAVLLIRSQVYAGPLSPT